MAINKKIEAAINAQINAEFYSAYLYLSMSSQAQELKLPGVANWFNIQYQEELAHAMGFINFLIKRDGRVILTAIDAPQTEWPDAVAMFKHTCKHEAEVTALINNLCALAVEERDFATSQILNWYVKEQVEEEATSSTVLGELEAAQNTPSALLMLDRELGTRTFVQPIIG
ncbi:MAG: ferritin [Thermoguttaceae bacterium]